MGQARTIIRFGAALLALASPLLFPLGITIILAGVGAIVTPLLPLAVGLIFDALYWHGSASWLPWASLVGALLSIVAFFVHRYVRTSIMYG